MVARARRVVWAASAQRALDEVVAYIWADSPSNAVRVLDRALEAAGSLSTLADRGRIVREVNDPALRELLVFDYRLLYRVLDDEVVVRAFLHGARDFSKWQREQKTEL